jgi:hypothetical protein
MNDKHGNESSGLGLKVGVAVVVAAVLAIAYARSGSNDPSVELERERLGSSMRRDRIRARLQNLGEVQKRDAAPQRRVKSEAAPRPVARIDKRIARRPGPMRKPQPKSALRDVPRRPQPAAAGAARPGTAREGTAPLISKSDSQNVPLLSEIALQDPDNDRRLEAVTLLGVAADPAAIPVLAQALADQDEEVRIAAISALADFTEEAPVEALEGALNDPSPDVRYEALEVLSEFGGDRARTAIQKAVNDPDEDVRWLAETLIDDLDTAEDEEG